MVDLLNPSLNQSDKLLPINTKTTIAPEAIYGSFLYHSIERFDRVFSESLIFPPKGRYKQYKNCKQL